MTTYPAPPKIERYPLPPRPHPLVVKTKGQNEVNYDPDFWELEYVPHRWLERVDDAELIKRYRHLVHNRRTFVGPRRDPMPIWSHESSWYWLRKDFITRLEFAMREVELPAVPATEIPQGAPPPLQRQNALYRFGPRDRMLELASGKVWFEPAKTFNEIENDRARQDEETAKHAYSAGQHVRIILPNGRKLPINGNMKTSVSGPGYNMTCFTNEWDAQFLRAFGEFCVVVHNIEEFARRIGEAGQKVFPGCHWMHTNAEYYDPYERLPDHKLRTPVSKDFLFAYQREYRFFWEASGAAPAEGKHVDIGPVSDILSVHDRNGNSL